MPEDNVKDDQTIKLTDAQKAELDRRLELLKASPDRGEPWEEVKKQLLDG